MLSILRQAVLAADPGITENVKPFPGSHPTLFHAVAWLRWQTDSY